MSDFKLVTLLNPPVQIIAGSIVGPAIQDGGANVATSGTVQFGNSNGVTFGLNAGTMTASFSGGGPGGGAALQGSGTFSQNTGTVQFANSNGVSFGLINGAMTATVATNYQPMGAYLTTAALSQNSSLYAGTGTSATNASITLDTNGLAISVAAPGAGGGAALQGSGTYTQNTGTVQFANSNNVTFGLNTNGIMTASVPSVGGAQTGISGIADSVSTVTVGTVQFGNANGVSFGLNGSTMTASLPQGIATSNSPTFADVNLSALTGNIIQHTDIVSGVQDIDDSLYSNSESGFGAWTSGTDADTYQFTGGKFQIDRSGYGYINGKKITWTANQQTGVLAANTFYWVYIDGAGTMQTSTTFVSNVIMLYEVLYDGTNYFAAKENHPKNFQSKVSGYLHSAINTIIFGTGANIARVTTGNGTLTTDRQIKIVGADTLSDHGLSTSIADSSGAGVTWKIFNRNSGGKWVQYASQVELAPFYNNAGTPTALDAVTNVYSVYVLYVKKDDINTSTPQYFAVMNEAGYTLLSSALAAITNGTVIFETNELKSMEAAQLGYAIVQYTAQGGQVEEVQVAKSSLTQQFVGGGGGAAADHALLANLNYSVAGHVGFQSAGAYLITAMVSDAGSRFVNTSAGLNLTSISATFNSNSISLSVGPYITTGMVSDAGSRFVNTSAGTNGTNVSMTFNSNSISISVRAQQTGISGIAGSGVSTVTNGTVQFANSNGMSFGLNGSTMTGSYTVPTVPGATVFSNSNNVSFGLNGSTITATATFAFAQSTQPVAFSATNGSAAFSTLKFADSGGVSWSTGTQGIFVNSIVAGAAAGIGAFADSVSSVTSGTVQFANSNGVSFGLNGSTMTASVLAGGGGIAISASDSAFTSGTVSLNQSGALTIGTGAQAINFSVPATSSLSAQANIVIGTTGSTIGLSVPQVTLSQWYPYEWVQVASNSVLGQNSLYFVPMMIDDAMYAHRIVFPASVSMGAPAGASTGSGGITFSAALYARQTDQTDRITSFWSGSHYMRMNVSSQTNISLTYATGIANSTSVAYTSYGVNNATASNQYLSSVNGFRALAIPLSSSLTAGQYWMAVAMSTTTGATATIGVSIFQKTIASMVGLQNLNVASAASNAGIIGFSQGFGTYGTISGGFPGSVTVTNNNIRNQVVGVIPMFAFSGWTTNASQL